MMTTEGFHWIGLARALQGDIVACIGTILILLLLAIIARIVVKKFLEKDIIDSDEALGIKKWTNRLVIILMLFTIFVFGWRIVNFMLANRIPRADVDGSSVYQKMDSHK